MKYLHFLLAISVVVFACKSGEQQQASVQTAQTNLPSGEVFYTAPEEWVAEAPSSSMRKAQFKLPGVEGAEDAELAVFFFPGTGGSVQANLSRWYGQFKQPDGKPTAAVATSEKRTVNGVPVTITYATGTYLKGAGMMMGEQHPATELPDYALLAAIAETAQGPWFFKAVGPIKTIDHWRKAFDEFVNTFKVGPAV